MNIEEQLKRYRENQNIIPDEQHIKETVRKSIEVISTSVVLSPVVTVYV